MSKTLKFTDPKKLKTFLTQRAKQKSIRKPITIQFTHANRTKQFTLAKQSRKTIDRAMVYLEWSQKKDTATWVRTIFNRPRTEQLITIAFNTSHGTKFIHKVQNADIPIVKGITTKDAIDQYYTIVQAYGITNVYPTAVDYEPMVVIKIPKYKDKPISSTTRLKKLKGKASNYYVVDGKIFKYRKY